MKFSDISTFTSEGGYQVNIHLLHLKSTLDEYKKDYGLELCPDFQRGNVWTEKQQIAWLEFYFRGGKTNAIYFNSPAFINRIEKHSDLGSTILCIDGLQRLTTILKFLNNEIKVFGLYLNEFENWEIGIRPYTIVFNINGLQTRAEVLQWYIDMNCGGTVHPVEEIERVRALLADCKGEK